MTGGARGDPTAKRRELERLREVAQRQAVLAELCLQSRPERAGLDARGARDLVELEYTVQRAEVDRDHSVVAGAHV